MRKIYIVGKGFNGYANWMQGEIAKNIEEANLVVFCGGEDVDPRVYGEPMGKHTYSSIDRDIAELEEFKTALELNIPIIGICRGSQFVCIASGGRLVQHQENPGYIHSIETFDHKILDISSTHHQAAYPYDMAKEDYKLLGWTNGISEYHLNGLNVEISDKPFKEVEIIYYPKSNCLGIQGHPEMLFGSVQYNDTITYLQELLNKFLNKEL